ncbi:hypothetical protein [uncultured Anaerovibrio sp.]|uniref:hypothetical protein n=1 Tax=uncultured Anaerovibrio sp. TaxID=361586 RepID=UPI0025F8CC32|nr:hypothetical protein [uncultured Anaerovibrio sp.]
MEEMDKCKKKGRELLTALREASSGEKENLGQWLPCDHDIEVKEFCLFHIKELTFEKEAPRREAMENILGMFRGMEGVSFIYLILGDSKGASFYFGVAKDFAYKGSGVLTAPTVGHDILGAGIRGNFRGSIVEELSNEEKKSILERLKDVEHAGILTGVPGTDKDSEGFQGVDRLMDVMSGDDFGFMVIARPASNLEMDALKEELISIEETLSPLARHTLQRTKQKSTGENKSVAKTNSEQNSNGWNRTESTSQAFTENKNHTFTSSRGNSQQETDGETSSRQYSSSENVSDSKTESNHRVVEKDSYGPKNTIDEGDSSVSNSSIGSQYSAQQQASYVFSYQINEGDNTTLGSQENKSKGESKQENYGHTLVKSESNNTNESTSDITAVMEQMEVETRSAAGWLKYIEEVLLARLDYGRGKGIFISSAYLFAGSPAMLRRLSSTAISLYSGPKGNKSPLTFRILQKEDDKGLKSLQNMQLPIFQREDEKTWLTALSCVSKENVSYAGSWLSAEDLSILAALPKKEVPGLALREEVAFGLNIEPPEGEKIPLGNLVQDGVEKSIPISLEKSALDKHTFITGVTGSGKTTTCQNILLGSELPFLVIEPAKTEYRVLLKRCPDLLFFTPGKQDIAPFFLNPFEILPGEAITSRADMIKATLEASFDMEAAIPQIMETAIYRAYEEKGWDISANAWRPFINGCDEPRDPFAKGVYPFPTLNDFWEAVKKVTEEEGFGERLQNEYMGSLKARIESLLVGAKGMMLNTPRSLDWNDLIDRHVVIELEEIKNGAEKSLLMGFILTNLMQAVKSRHAEDSTFQHITLVEEAHRLLSRYVPGDSMNKKQGVEVFADMLAEVRKYGESLIIADQIPDKMTPEVLKNTNTKIVHKLFARDDKDAIGDTMALSDDQKAFLSKLPTGRAIIFSQGWTKALQVKVKKEANTTGEEKVPSDVIKSIAEHYYADKAVIESGVLPGIEHLPVEATEEIVSEYLWIMRTGLVLKKRYKELVADPYNNSAGEKLRREILYVKKRAGIRDEVWQTWLYRNLYEGEGEEGFSRFKGIMEKIIAADDYTAMEEAMSSFQREVLGYLHLGTSSAL